MITAEQLDTLTKFTPPALARALAVSGHKETSFKAARFLGITNAGQFCYRVEFHEEDPMGQSWTKVFLTYNPEMGSVTAGY